MIFSLLFSIFSFGQNVKEAARLSGPEPHTLYVAFNTDLDFNYSETYISQADSLIPELRQITQQYGITLEKGIAISDEKLEEMESMSKANGHSGQSVKVLRNIFKVDAINSDNPILLTIAQKLEALPLVAYCDLISSQPVRPPGDILPVTPSYETQQTYINANPGVNMTYAWNLGVTGNGIRVRDVEYGFNKSHEEFNDSIGASIKSGMVISPSADADYIEHGTAVFGIVYGHKGNYGVSGMAYGAQEMMLFPEYLITGYNRINAVTQAIANSVSGDVIIYEMQTQGENSAYVPAEFNATVWTLTKAATDAGIVVVAAAGNGNQNLDGTYYANYRNRGNSGAIIVGGGTSTTSHNKVSYSTYGARVDLQAWAQNVRTTGYGDYSTVGNDFNQRYTTFSGTSSATPIVASCAIVLQSYYHTLTGNYLTSVQIRDILINTGIPQGTGGHIGPIPNMQAAIDAVNLLSVEHVGKGNFVVFPNPVADQVTIVGSDLSGNARVEIMNTLGQTVYQQMLSNDKTINISGLVKGVYFLRISDKGSTAVRKILKK